jgi:hypothetical protein
MVRPVPSGLTVPKPPNLLSGGFQLTRMNWPSDEALAAIDQEPCDQTASRPNCAALMASHRATDGTTRHRGHSRWPLWITDAHA